VLQRYEEVAKGLRSSGAKPVYANLARQLRQLANQAESSERTTECESASNLDPHPIGF
jgi:hypothetical protein